MAFTVGVPTPKDIKFLQLAREGARIFSTCSKAQFFALIVDPLGRIVGTGYNGSPPGHDHCTDGGCPRANGTESGGDYDNCVAAHAEANALVQTNQAHGSTIYVGALPCWGCTKLILTAGVVRLVYTEGDRVPVDRDRVLAFLALSPIEVVLVHRVPPVTARTGYGNSDVDGPVETAVDVAPKAESTDTSDTVLGDGWTHSGLPRPTGWISDKTLGDQIRTLTSMFGSDLVSRITGFDALDYNADQYLEPGPEDHGIDLKRLAALVLIVHKLTPHLNVDQVREWLTTDNYDTKETPARAIAGGRRIQPVQAAQRLVDNLLLPPVADTIEHMETGGPEPEGIANLEVQDQVTEVRRILGATSAGQALGWFGPVPVGPLEQKRLSVLVESLDLIMLAPDGPMPTVQQIRDWFEAPNSECDNISPRSALRYGEFDKIAAAVNGFILGLDCQVPD